MMNNDNVLAQQLYSIPDEVDDELADEVIEDWESSDKEDKQSETTDNIKF